MVVQYYNSGQFIKTMSYLAGCFLSPFFLYEALASYWRDHTETGQNFSRNARYERLLDFVAETLPEKTEEARALLIYDLYLREPVKSRPAFAGDLSACREEISDRSAVLWERERTEGRTALPYRRFLHETHMEVFFRDPEHPERKGQFWYWFDYRERDPLSGNGRAYRLESRNGE